MPHLMPLNTMFQFKIVPLKRASYTSTVSATVIMYEFRDGGLSVKQTGELDTSER